MSGERDMKNAQITEPGEKADHSLTYRASRVSAHLDRSF